MPWAKYHFAPLGNMLFSVRLREPRSVQEYNQLPCLRLGQSCDANLCSKLWNETRHCQGETCIDFMRFFTWSSTWRWTRPCPLSLRESPSNTMKVSTLPVHRTSGSETCMYSSSACVLKKSDPIHSDSSGHMCACKDNLFQNSTSFETWSFVSHGKAPGDPTFTVHLILVSRLFLWSCFWRVDLSCGAVSGELTWWGANYFLPLQHILYMPWLILIARPQILYISTVIRPALLV